MTRFYSNENFPFQTMEALRLLGHDILSSLNAGQANRRIPDEKVLEFAAAQNRILLTLNRRDFILLHNLNRKHAGVVVCSPDPDTHRQAERIHQAVMEHAVMTGTLLRIDRPSC